MRNHPAFVRLLNYIDANSVTVEQIRNATAAQVLRIMYPPDGVMPKGEYLTKTLVLRGLTALFQERREERQRVRLREKLEAAGLAVDDLEGAGRDYTVRLRDDVDPDAVGAVRL